ncbi:MAG: hypothetical protein AB7G23_01215 [Vicinamibacterales bacterium]
MRSWFSVAVAALLVVLGSSVALSAQGIGLGRLMRLKLDHAGSVLEALVTSDWEELETHSQALSDLTRDPAWMNLQFSEYNRYTQAFVRANDELGEAARQKDLEAAALGYVALTTSCISCHRYVARARLAGNPVPR